MFERFPAIEVAARADQRRPVRREGCLDIHKRLDAVGVTVQAKAGADSAGARPTGTGKERET